MDSHEKYAALLDAFIDGELSAQEAEEVREHLALCADCRAYVSDALAMRDAFPDIEETVVPDGFAESVLSALPPRQIPWRAQWKKFVLPLAACLAVFLLVRGLPRIGESTGSGDVYKIGDAVSESVTSDTDAGGETPMMTFSYSDTMPPTDSNSADDADTMPPQASESYNTAQSAAASRKAAPQERSQAQPSTEEALDGVLLSAGNVETDAATESAFDEDTAPDTEALPASGNPAPAPVPEPVPNSAAPEDAEAELYSAPVSVWTVPAGAASLLESYTRAGETESGVWYALTPEEFDGVISQLADRNMKAVPADELPPTFPDAEYYIFVPL